MNKFIFSFLVISLFLFFMGEVQGASPPDCNFLSVTDVNFGSYDVLSANNNDSTGSIGILCTGPPWITVTTSIGPSPNSGGFNPRQMKQTTGTDLLNYNLYTNSSRATIWGDGTQGTQSLTVNIQKNHPWTGTIYGRSPPGQNVGIGNYGEVLVITINF